ncbi:MAG: hypothetical protein A2Z34_07945, partial [Planctomycetes bacterium RBG_16_59_8]
HLTLPAFSPCVRHPVLLFIVAMARITYSDRADFHAMIRMLIEGGSLKKICEIGGGANPLLKQEYISARGLDYTILDISEEELEKASTGCRKLVADITDRELNPSPQFDLVFSRMLAEHVSDAETFHGNVRALLVQGGLACHFFPTLYALPFVINLLLPERLTGHILHLLSPRNRHKHGKFPAFYRWCYGPLPQQIRRLEGLKYEVIEYKGFFGHEGYYRRLPGIRNIHVTVTKALLKRPNPYLTSYAYVIMKKI